MFTSEMVKTLKVKPSKINYAKRNISYINKVHKSVKFIKLKQ